MRFRKTSSNTIVNIQTWDGSNGPHESGHVCCSWPMNVLSTSISLSFTKPGASLTCKSQDNHRKETYLCILTLTCRVEHGEVTIKNA